MPDQVADERNPGVTLNKQSFYPFTVELTYPPNHWHHCGAPKMHVDLAAYGYCYCKPHPFFFFKRVQLNDLQIKYLGVQGAFSEN